MINLSYIISTRNRLPFLKITLEKLLSELQDYEEIVVVDGSSTDGTQTYLLELFDSGKIHQFLTEPDKNQAHGWNKAMLMARGKIIKKIIDDDIYDYNEIRKCADYLLKNPEIDVVISNDLSTNLNCTQQIAANTRLQQFIAWKNGETKSFTFGDVHLLIRKSALAYIGLYNTSYVMMDWEYALRISYLNAKITYYTGYNAMSVFQDESVSGLKNDNLIKEQGRKAQMFYEYNGDTAELSAWSKLKIIVGKILLNKKIEQITTKLNGQDLNLLYQTLYKKIHEINQTITPTFIDSKVEETD